VVVVRNLSSQRERITCPVFTAMSVFFVFFVQRSGGANGERSVRVAAARQSAQQALQRK